MHVTRKSPMSGEYNSMDLPVTPAQLDQVGTRCIQDIFPDLTPMQREFIKSGYTEAEQAALFAPPPEPTVWRCPKCGSDSLFVVASIMVKLIQSADDPDDFQTEYEGGDHEWDSDSPMRCNACEHSAPALDFEVKEPA